MVQITAAVQQASAPKAGKTPKHTDSVIGPLGPEIVLYQTPSADNIKKNVEAAKQANEHRVEQNKIKEAAETAVAKLSTVESFAALRMKNAGDDPADNSPKEVWLARANQQIHILNQLKRAASRVNVEATIVVWRIGKSLRMLKATCLHGEFTEMKKLLGVAGGTYDRATKLYDAVSDPSVLAGVPLMKALRDFGIMKKPEAQPALETEEAEAPAEPAPAADEVKVRVPIDPHLPPAEQIVSHLSDVEVLFDDIEPAAADPVQLQRIKADLEAQLKRIEHILNLFELAK